MSINKLIENIKSFPSIQGTPSDKHINNMTGEQYVYQHFVIMQNHSKRLKSIFDALRGADLVVWRYEGKVITEVASNKIVMRLAAVKDGKQLIICPSQEFDPFNIETVH